MAILYKHTKWSIYLFVLLHFSSCKKQVEIAPPATFISAENVFTNDQTAISALTGLYIDLSKGISTHGYFAGTQGLSLMLGLSADELTLYDLGLADYNTFYSNIFTSTKQGINYWSPLYTYIFRCNSAIEGLNDPSAEALTPFVRKQLLGEATFMRAFFYFHLTNMYGDVPLALTTDYKVNTLLARSSQTHVYQQIIEDLKAAKDLLTIEYPDVTLLKISTERVRPTQWAARALLARMYLYTGDNANAELESSTIIENALFSLPPVLNDVFLKTSTEAIWQVQPVTAFFNTDDARAFVLTSFGPTSQSPAYISGQLLDGFEPGDLRRTGKNWVDSVIIGGVTYFFPYKYKDNLYNSNITGVNGPQYMIEYQMMLRLAEQYLIRSEARAKQNNLTGAITDIDKIRKRAGLPLIADNNPAISQDDLLDAILHERQMELFTEYGHRWFDLKRTGKVDDVMSIATPIKSLGTSQWQSHQQFFPIPKSDLDQAPNLTQTSGY
ncbi:MAG: RagB/SusD family nutrient uptake outer membrane protein [Chitinophagaceae bacterium]|nr:RagB/SusD family nutrient uptake outer membrane protein [Chitinophagaceae bacterium]